MKSTQKRFTHQPGCGSMFKNSTSPQGVAFWGGKFTVPAGTRVVLADGKALKFAKDRPAKLDATAHRAGPDLSGKALKAHLAAGGDRYEVKIVAIDDEKGWKHLGEFKLPAFAGRRNQIVDTPVGKLKAFVRKPVGNADASIQFRMLVDTDGVSHADMPM